MRVDRFAPKIDPPRAAFILFVPVAILAHATESRCQPDSRVIAATGRHALADRPERDRVGNGMAEPPEPPTVDPSNPNLPLSDDQDEVPLSNDQDEVPLSDIQDAVTAQYTDDVKREAERYAKDRALRMRRAGIPIPAALDDYAKELVHDAMVSIWIGARAWNPSIPLLPHLCLLVKDRTWREIQRAERHRRISFDLAANDRDDARDDDEHAIQAPPGVGDDVEAALVASRGDITTIRFARIAREVVDALRQLSTEDDTVRRVLAAWELGFFERDAVLAITKLDEDAYDAARKRIRRLAQRLPPDLREAALDLLRSAS